MHYHPDDTIAAIATAPGSAARAMVRVSGPDAVEIAAACFTPDNGRPLDEARQPTAFAGRVRISLADGGPRPLPCDLFLWPTSRSYTRQPAAELHTLGTPPLAEAVLAALCRAGARLAEPGEFTLRAFLAGRLDLTQAEAVLGVIDAQGQDDLDTALTQLAGGLARPLGQLRDELLQLLAELEAGLDFADEDIAFIAADELQSRLATAAALLADVHRQMASRLETGHAPQLVLTGPPNVGKSSLFNALVARYGVSGPSPAASHEAIVSPRPGTTRDYLTATLEIHGQRCELIDTAGIDSGASDAQQGGWGGAQRPPSESGGSLRSTPGTRSAASDIDAAAQSLAMERRAQAALRVLCAEVPHEGPLPPLPLVADSPWRGEGRGEGAGISSPPYDLIAVTKVDLIPFGAPFDLPNDLPPGASVVVTSSATGQGLDELAAELAELLAADATATRGQVVAATADRCREGVRLAADALARAGDVLAARGGDELVAVELRDALHHLGQVVGAVYTDDLLDRVFSTFCIGK